MRFISYYSSSLGNLYEVVSGAGQRLLIDPGVRWPKLQKAIGYDLRIDGVLCSHFHTDHSKASENIIEAGIDFYASEATLKNLELENWRKVHSIINKNTFDIGSDFRCFSFLLEHDAKGTMGFIIEDITTNETLLYINDTFMVKYKFAVPFSIIAISCNYDKTILTDRVTQGKINETYAKRLLTSHMEKEVTKDYIRKFCNLSKCTQIYLLHISGTNADRKKIAKEFEDEFFIETIAGVP